MQRAQKTLGAHICGSGGTGTLANIVQVSGGYNFTVALAGDGTVWSWGDTRVGELGDWTTTNRSSPVEVVGSGGTGNLTGIITVSAGYL